MAEHCSVVKIVVLAAGSGDRFKGNKLLAKIDGRPLLQVVIDKIHHGLSPVEGVAVVGYNHQQLKSQLNFKSLSTVTNDRWDRGMSTSLSTGIEACSSAGPGYLIVLGDMPFIPGRIYARVVKAGRKSGGIVAPDYEGKRGFPVYFDSSYTDALRQKPAGDQGARNIIAEHEEQFRSISVSTPGVIRDVDTVSDLDRIRG